MSDRVLPWFKVYPREALSDADFASWSLEERGAWLTLVLHNWIEGSLPESMDALARLVGVQRNEISALWTVLGRKFIPHPDYPGRITSPRLEIEREKAIALLEKRSAAGTKAITARWAKAKAKHTKRIRHEYAGDTNEVRSDTNSANQPPAFQPQIQPQGEPVSQKTDRLAGLDEQLMSVAAKLGAHYGRPGPLGAGKDWNRVCSSFQRWLETVGEDALVAECIRIAAEQHVQPSHLSWWPGWLDTATDAELQRAAGIQP